MWIVELNVLGRKFTHEVHAGKTAAKFDPRTVGARLSHLRLPRTAA